MLAALREKRIAGYGADNYDAEPAPANHPLRSEPRALLTPHLGYVTEETYRGFYAAPSPPSKAGSPASQWA